MSFRSVRFPPDLSAINDSSMVRTMYNWVELGPTFLRGTFKSYPLSGSRLPLSAGSSWGSIPRIQSAQVSLTDTIILKLKLKVCVVYLVCSSVPNREYCQGIHVGFEKNRWKCSFFRFAFAKFEFWKQLSKRKKDQSALLQKRTEIKFPPLLLRSTFWFSVDNPRILKLLVCQKIR